MRATATLLIAGLLAAGPAFGLDETDVGTYAIVHVDGHVTSKIFRVTHPTTGWKVEDKKPDGSWEDVTCEADCTMVESPAKDVERFLGKAPKGMKAECIHNSAFGVCRVTDEKKPGERQYVFVALTEQYPITLRLARQGPGK